MTPNQLLTVKRLLVTKGARLAYDEVFHSGVNIIRGANGSGKSSVMDLLFYGLGGDFNAWKPEPASCDLVFVEVEFSSEVVTLRREISDKKNQPLWIWFGSAEEARNTTEGWSRYGYARSDSRESFSQAIFRLLNIPDVTADDDTNITFHQLLRILYVDQITPVSRLFRFEQFDTPQRRQAVGDLILGVYDRQIYATQAIFREKVKEFEQISGDLQNLYRLLGRSGESVSIRIIEQAESDARDAISDLEQYIEKLRKNASDEIEKKQGLSKGIIDKIRSDIALLTDQIDGLNDQVSGLEFSIEDSKSLVAELSKNLKQLNDGFVVRNSLAGFSFNFCPACYAVLEESEKDSCLLCKTPFDGDEEEKRLGRIRTQIELQMKESDRLIGLKAEEVEKKSEQARKLEALREGLQLEYRALRADYSSDVELELEKSISQLGYKRRELEEIAERKERVRFILDLQSRKAELNAEISDLEETLKQLNAQARKRRLRVIANAAEKAGNMLELDLKSEDEFVNNPVVNFDFWDDNITVNDRKEFSASSLTVLRNAVHFALLWASTEDMGMYYPRFLMLDNVEDNGMTQQRSHNFQKIMVELSSNMKVSHQIIFTTSMIVPELDDSDLVVGEHYTYEQKSLRV